MKIQKHASTQPIDHGQRNRVADLTRMAPLIAGETATERREAVSGAAPDLGSGWNDARLAPEGRPRQSFLISEQGSASGDGSRGIGSHLI